MAAGTAAERAWNPWRAYLVLTAIAWFVVSRWFRTGTFIATGDMGPWIRQGWRPEFLWSWNHSVTGAGSAAYNVARGFELILIDVVKFFGSDEYTAQWIFYSLIYTLVAVGVGYLAAALVRSELAVIAAGTFGILNGFFLTRLPNPLNIISVGIVALLTGLALRVALGRNIPAPVAGLALLPTSFLGFNPPMLVVAYAWTLAGTPLLAYVLLGRRPAWRLLRWMPAAGFWAVLINIWWLVPLAQSFTGGGGAQANATFTDPMNWSWAQINNSVPNVLTMVANWAWFLPQYLPFAGSLDHPGWVWIRYLLPALVFAAPLLARRERRRIALGSLAMALVFVVLAKGLQPPFTGFNYWLYLHAPGFWLFREPMSKLGQLLVLLFAILLAIAVEAAYDALSTRVEAYGGWRQLVSRRADPLGSIWSAAPIVAVVGVLAYPFPLYTGAVMPDERPSQPSAHVRVPDYWWDTAARIDADPRPGKVLILPLDDYYQMPTAWGFFGVDSIANLLLEHPVVQRKPDGYFGDSAGFAANVQAIETALVSGDVDAVPPLLEALSISEIIVRHDLIRGLPGRSFADDRVITAAMARVDGVRRVQRGPLDIWQVGDGSSPLARAWTSTLDAPADAAGTAAAIASTDGNRALVSRPDESVPPLTPVVDHAPDVADDVITWSVPPTDLAAAGQPTSAVTTVEVPTEGSFTLDQRLRAGAVLTPTWSDRRQAVLLRDPTRVVVDGEPTAPRPPTVLPVDAPERPVALTAGPRTVSLDRWRTRDTGARSVVVGAATPTTMWARSTEPAQTGLFSDVYDCNNYEPRPASELGLRLDRLGDPDGPRGSDGVLRLSADDHAACTRLVVEDARPGRTYRVRLEYRQVEGKRPQVCLWQTDTDGCELAPRPVMERKWTAYERFVTVDEVADGLQVVLHADVGQRLLGRTVSEYRRVRVEALDPIAEARTWPEPVPTTTVQLDAGSHEIEVRGGPSGSVLAPFEPLQDCFRYDDQTPEQAGLFAKGNLRHERGRASGTLSLGARVHMACLGATAPGFGSSSLYELAYEARSMRLRDPKVCLYLRGPDRCATLPTGLSWDGWTRYSAPVRPDPGAVETRVYLYGLRDLEESRVSRVDYREVALRPVASPVDVVLVRETTDAEPPAVRWDRRDPAHIAVAVDDAPAGTIVGLAESAAPGWALPDAGEKVTAMGWRGAWEVEGDLDAVAAYVPAEASRLALASLPIALGLASVWLLIAPMVMRRVRAARRRAWRALTRRSRS